MKSRHKTSKSVKYSKSRRKTIKNALKTTTKPHPPDDKFAELYELQDKYNKLLVEYNAKPSDSKQKELLKIMNEINTQRQNINSYYPSISDELFNGKLAAHPLFNKYSIPYDKSLINDFYTAYTKNTGVISRLRDTKSDYFVLKPSQNFLANFMSPYSPYKGLFIIHGTGVGKSCTAITIAEQMKSLVNNSNTNIYILRPEAMESAIFDLSRVKAGKPLMQCTHDTYMTSNKAQLFKDSCIAGNNEDCERLQRLVQKERDKYYTLVGTRKWANDVNKLIEDKVKGKTGIEREERISQILRKHFDNSVIIIDEAHKMRDNSTNEDKIVPPVLRQVLSTANNIRLILMTATPIFDKPQDIISLINYMLVNDRRPVIDSSSVFEADGTLKSKGRDILIENTRGYISYLRGNNPFDFPLRIPAKLVVPEQVLDPRKYPKQDLYGNTIKPFDPIKYLNIIDCPMEGEQRKIFDKFSKMHKIVINDDDFSQELDYELEVPVNDTEFSELSEKLDSDSDIKSSGMNPNIINNSKKVYNSVNKRKTTLKINNTNAKQIETLEDDVEHSVAHSDELQIGDFVYQSLDETSGNTKLCYGNAGLHQICSRVGRTGPVSYKFIDETYASRFKMSELSNWSSKLARLIKNIENAKGPVFIYTRFLAAGAIPIAFALEMAGYKRYRMHNTPLLQYQGKSQEYKGDYIIYSGDPKISQYAQTYIEKGSSMMRDNVKVFIGTQKVCEGISLFGYREAHILEPWHNINLIEQSIGRTIRTLSHAELPPQERNVTVYLYASTLGNRESVDLKIYKISENKAIKAGAVEKLLKENAIDCAPYEYGNTFSKEMFPEPVSIKTSNGKTIKFNIADEPFTYGCFYQDTCEFKCLGQLNDKEKIIEQELYNIPIQTENYIRDRDSIIALLINLLHDEPNIDIALAKKRLNITKLNEHSFNSAIEVLINTQRIIKDKNNKDNYLVKHMNILRLVPIDMKYSDIPMQQQYLMSLQKDNPISSINLQSYISILGEEKKELSETMTINYKQIIDNFNSIINNTNTFKSNLNISQEDKIWLLFSKLTYNEKFAILKYLLTKIVKFARNNNGRHPVLTNIEELIEPCVMNHVIYINNIYPSMATNNNIHGFMILNEDKLDYYSYSDIDGEFVKDQGNIRKVIEFKKGKMIKTPNSKIYGFLKYDSKGSQPIFKIKDQLQKGDKKSVKGISCSSKMITDIRGQIDMLDKSASELSKSITRKDILCNNIEYVFYEKDKKLQGGNKWYYTPEENFIYFGN